MTSNGTTTEGLGQGFATLEAPPPRIPGMISAQVKADTASLSTVSEVPALAATLAGEVALAATTQRITAEPLRFPQKVSDIRTAATALQVAEQGSDRTCVLPKGLIFTGEASFPCDVRIEGFVDGNVSAEPARTITVSNDGRFKGSLNATNIRIEGSADGDVNAKGGLASFGPTAICKGHVTYSRLKIAEGADVEATMKKLAA